MHKSGMFTFGLLMSSLVMLSAMPLFSQQQNSLFSNVMAQGYNNYYEIVLIANIQPMTKNMNVEQVLLKDSS